MKLTISGRHNDKKSKSVQKRIQQKSLRLEKILGPQIHLRWIYSHREEVNMVELRVIGGKGEFHATALGRNLYHSMDLVVEKIEKQIKRYKAKIRSVSLRLEKSQSLRLSDVKDQEDLAEDEFFAIAS